MADKLVEYDLGTPFPGTIGKTIDDSKEAWPVPKRAPSGTPNVLFYVLDKMNRLDHAHGIWHMFVLMGSSAHFVAVIGYVR